MLVVENRRRKKNGGELSADFDRAERYKLLNCFPPRSPSFLYNSVANLTFFLEAPALTSWQQNRESCLVSLRSPT